MELDGRIVKALSEPSTSEEAQEVLTAAEAEFRTLEQRADALDVEALSPMLHKADALAKRSEAADLRFDSDRLDASVSALRDRVARLREAEAAAVRKAERDAAVEERDELAGEIAERYPAIVRELTGLAERIAASDARCKAVGIAESAETMGRGLPASFHIPGRGTAGRIGDINLPMPADVLLAWSVDRLGGSVTYRGKHA